MAINRWKNTGSTLGIVEQQKTIGAAVAYIYGGGEWCANILLHPGGSAHLEGNEKKLKRRKELAEQAAIRLCKMREYLESME